MITTTSPLSGVAQVIQHIIAPGLAQDQCQPYSSENTGRRTRTPVWCRIFLTIQWNGNGSGGRIGDQFTVTAILTFSHTRNWAGTAMASPSRDFCSYIKSVLKGKWSFFLNFEYPYITALFWTPPCSHAASKYSLPVSYNGSKGGHNDCGGLKQSLHKWLN